eukprot:4914108-Amphidinium_carterae.1
MRATLLVKRDGCRTCPLLSLLASCAQKIEPTRCFGKLGHAWQRTVLQVMKANHDKQETALEVPCFSRSLEAGELKSYLLKSRVACMSLHLELAKPLLLHKNLD